MINKDGLVITNGKAETRAGVYMVYAERAWFPELDKQLPNRAPLRIVCHVCFECEVLPDLTGQIAHQQRLKLCTICQKTAEIMIFVRPILV
jgi:hypothetical protein